MDDLLAAAKALSDETRVRALLALRGGEKCVCQLVALLELAPSTVSKHMSVLRAAGLVDSRKRGRWVYYRLAGEDAAPVARAAVALAFSAVSKSARAKEDAARLREIVRKSPEEICRLMAEG